MTYNDWYEEHAKKHIAIMKKLEGWDEFDIVQYFLFDNMVEKEPDFANSMQPKQSVMISMNSTAICADAHIFDFIRTLH